MLDNANTFLVIAVLSINMLATLVYLFFLASDNRKKKFFEMPVWLQKMFVLLFVGPLFGSPLLPQTNIPMMGLDVVRIWVGVILTTIGFGLIIASFLKIGVIPSLREKSGLITQGVYGIVRHPIYSGTIFAFFGLNFVFNSFISLLYLPVSIGLYLIMIIYEEKSLLNEYGEEYKSYQKNVPKRIIPFVI